MRETKSDVSRFHYSQADTDLRTFWKAIEEAWIQDAQSPTSTNSARCLTDGEAGPDWAVERLQLGERAAGDDMIFYHFTCPWRFWSEDWKQQYPYVPVRDLLPSNAQYGDDAPAPWCIPVVWLTTSTETVPADDPDIMRLRLTVRLPTTDLKLRSFAKWQEIDILPPDLREKAVSHWWTYRGVITAKRITEINSVMGQYPWWEE